MNTSTRSMSLLMTLCLLCSVAQGCFPSIEVSDVDSKEESDLGSPDVGLADMSISPDEPDGAADVPDAALPDLAVVDLGDPVDLADMAEENPLVIEAEEMTLSDGFEVLEDAAASGGAWIESSTRGTARHEFAGPVARYNIKVAYFDEDDGISELSFKLDDQVLDTWRWDADLGSSIAELATRTTHTIWGVEVSTGAELELAGMADGNEKLRVDQVVFEPCSGESCEAPVIDEPDLKPHQLVGFGSGVTGGRGGQVYAVTSTSSDPDEPGSFRWALEQGPIDQKKVILLMVEGGITIRDILRIKNANLTIDGSFAPGVGAWFEGRRIEFQGDNVLVQDVSFLGNDPTPDSSSDPVKVGNFNSGPDVDGVYFRRCAFMHGRDETFAFTSRSNGSNSGPRVLNVTLEGAIIANPVGDINGSHHFGMIVGDGTENVTIVDSLFSTVSARTPFIREHSKSIEFLNNVVYNCKENQTSSMSPETHVLGNVYRRGPYSGTGLFRPIRPNGGPSRLFIDDNRIRNAMSGDMTYHGDSANLVGTPLFTPSNAQVMASELVFDHVLAVSGPRHRGVALEDRFVHSLIEDARNGTGPSAMLNYPGEVPVVTGASPLAESDYIPAAYRALYPNDTSLEQVITTGAWQGYQVWERVAAWQTQ